MKIIALLCALLTCLSAFSYEKAEAFIVKVYDERVRVLSPVKFDPRLHLIIENKTLVNISGKVETERGEVLSFVNIEPGKSTSLNVKNVKTEKVFFVPLSPPLQRVELKLGSKPYEIPPRP